MMKNKYFHGTTAENLKILLNKQEKPSSCWSVSDQDNLFYVFDWHKFREVENEDESVVIQRAFQQAQIQAAIKGISQLLYVLELDLNDVEVDDDLSCEGMKEVASCISSACFDISMIKRVYITQFNQWYSPFILRDFIDNEIFNTHLIDETLLICAQNLSKETFFEDMFEFDYMELDTDTVLDQYLAVCV